jgi:hypothetical protein
MAVPVLLCGSETWTLRKRDWNRIQAAEMKYLRTVKGCSRSHQIRNEDISNELGIFPLSEKIIEYRNKWKAPSGKRDIDRPRRRWRQYYRREQEILLTHEVTMIIIIRKAIVTLLLPVNIGTSDRERAQWTSWIDGSAPESIGDSGVENIS